MENKEIELLSPKIDIVFHALFRESNNRLTEAFLTDVLEEKVKIIANLDRYMDIKAAEEKLGIMDLRVELEDNTNCNVEIQIKKYKNECDRFLYYLADTYSRQLDYGEEYKEINRCISIVIVDHEVNELKDVEKINTKWQMRDNTTGMKILTNKFELIIIELPKAKKLYLENKEDRICQWMMFFDDPNSKEVDCIMEKNTGVKEAKEELRSVSGDYEIRRIAELKQKYIRDEKAALSYATEEAIKEGLEKGLKQGLKQGIEQGIERGIEQGERKSKIEIAKRLLEKEMNIDEIVEITELSYDEVSKLKE